MLGYRGISIMSRRLGLSSSSTTSTSTASSSRTFTSSATASFFTPARKASAISFSKTLAGCSVLGYTLSNYVLTDDLLEPVYESIYSVQTRLQRAAATFGTKVSLNALPEALAFSLPDDGLHAPHHPWEHKKWWKSFDHAAYVIHFIIFIIHFTPSPHFKYHHIIISYHIIPIINSIQFNSKY